MLERGKSYTGDDIVADLGGEREADDRLAALGNDDVIYILRDEGNDIYRIIGVLMKDEIQIA